jgi:hypothetical protein
LNLSIPRSPLPGHQNRSGHGSHHMRFRWAGISIGIRLAREARSNMRFVPIKSDDQLDMQSLHRVRQSWVGRRTSVINQIRGLLLARGITIRKGRRYAEAGLPQILENPDMNLSGPYACCWCNCNASPGSCRVRSMKSMSAS